MEAPPYLAGLFPASLAALPSVGVVVNVRNQTTVSQTARENEIDFIGNHQLIDAFLTLHQGRLDDVRLEGCTWGFPKPRQKTDRKALPNAPNDGREVNRVHNLRFMCCR